MSKTQYFWNVLEVSWIKYKRNHSPAMLEKIILQQKRKNNA